VASHRKITPARAPAPRRGSGKAGYSPIMEPIVHGWSQQQVKAVAAYLVDLE
jgi:hypothetical protein